MSGRDATETDTDRNKRICTWGICRCGAARDGKLEVREGVTYSVLRCDNGHEST